MHTNGNIQVTETLTVFLQSVLDEADMDELKRIGAELREHIETVKAAKTEQVAMELEVA